MAKNAMTTKKETKEVAQETLDQWVSILLIHKTTLHQGLKL
jgi:hypothetical protein